MMLHTSRGNSILNQLLASGDYSEDSLKRIYKRLCKTTHPDLTGKKGEDFVRLQEEYEAARLYLGRYQRKLELTRSSLRKNLYKSLAHYTASGLHSQRVRLKTELRDRNELIFRKVVSLAFLYDPDFAAIFTAYSSAGLQTYSEWQQGERVRTARKHFIAGLNAFFSYQQTASPLPRRTAVSYLEDCITVLGSTGVDEQQKVLSRFAEWLLGELELPPARIEEEGNEYGNDSLHR